MAREYARIWLSIWSDFEFKQLDPEPQWLYFALISQPGLSTAGVQTYSPRRWAGLAPKLTIRRVETGIRQLEAGRLVIVDRETDELLIRSHIRYDRPLKNANVAKSLARTWAQISSTELQKAVLIELRRLHGEGDTGSWPGWKVAEIQHLLEIPVAITERTGR